MLATETDFKRLPRLRYRRNPEDQAIEAYCVRKALRNDHLTFWGPGELAIYYRRSGRGAGSARAAWLRQLAAQGVEIGQIREIRGDGEGLILFPAEDEQHVPDCFLKSAARQAAGRARHELD